GISHATHTFNGMNPLHHRAPGVPGAVLTAPGVSAEIIADGFHIHPGVARLLWQVKGPDRLLLVTDAMRATDLPDGRYDLGGLEVDVVGGAARLAGQEPLAGSALTLERAVAWMGEAVGLSLAEAVQLASLNPARRLGVAHRLGSLEVGKDASLVLLDDALRVRLTLRQGELIYDGQGDEFEDAAHGGAGALDGEPSEMLDHEEAYWEDADPGCGPGVVGRRGGGPRGGPPAQQEARHRSGLAHRGNTRTPLPEAGGDLPAGPGELRPGHHLQPGLVPWLGA